MPKSPAVTFRIATPVASLVAAELNTSASVGVATGGRADIRKLRRVSCNCEGFSVEAHCGAGQWTPPLHRVNGDVGAIPWTEAIDKTIRAQERATVPFAD